MATPRKPWGYADDDLLDQALAANARMGEILQEMADGLAQHPRLAGRAIRLAGLLAAQARSLLEIQKIRQAERASVRVDPQSR